MILHVLMDNRSCSSEFASEHGLALFIETGQENILFDTGASDAFIKNAHLMGVDLGSADLSVLSHGHYDHGGGLEAFFRVNDTAPVYVQTTAFDGYYKQGKEWKYIGLPETVKKNPRFLLKKGSYRLGRGLEVLSGIRPRRLNPQDNRLMYRQEATGMQPDDFSHEQNLILTEEGKHLLITGCAHQGIVNILEEYFVLKGAYPDVVLGGFHLLDDDGDKTLEGFVKEIGEFLKSTGSLFYTGHCTGEKAFGILKDILGDRIGSISSGTVLKLFDDSEE